MLDYKEYNTQLSDRFLEEMERHIGKKSEGKGTAEEFGKRVGLASSNIARVKSGRGKFFIPPHVCYNLCQEYGTPWHWIFMGVNRPPDEETVVNEKIKKLDGMIRRLERLLAANETNSAANTIAHTFDKKGPKTRKLKK